MYLSASVSYTILQSLSLSTVDFCTGNSEQSGPAGTVMGIFEERGITSEDIIYVAFQYFQSVSSFICVEML